METTSHGTEEFPVAIYETLLRKNILGFVDWHWHSELRFVLLLQAQSDLQSIHSRLTLKKEMAFINSGIMHTSKPLTEDASICMY